MTGDFGTDGLLEAELRRNWLDALHAATGFDPRLLVAQDDDYGRRSSRFVEQQGRLAAPRAGTSRGRDPRDAERDGQGEAWVTGARPRVGERDDRDGRVDGRGDGRN